MSVDYIKSYNDLEQELETARITLIALNDSIRRFAGRSPKLSRYIESVLFGLPEGTRNRHFYLNIRYNPQ